MPPPHGYYFRPSSLASHKPSAGKVCPLPHGDSLFDESTVILRCLSLDFAKIGEDGVPILPPSVFLTHDAGMTDPGINVKVTHILDHAGTLGLRWMERVSSMKIGILLADNRREPILEKMTVPLMPPVEIEDVARENLSRA
jgi:hypothetical protein